MGMQIVELCERALLLDHGVRLMYSLPLQVVRAYQKLIYAPVEEQARLMRHYQAADQGITEEPEKQEDGVAIKAQPDLPGFDAGLVPETTQVYPVQGAEISSFRIFDSEGQPVNVLQPGQDYRFEVAGRFLSDREHIYFGLQIRSTSGTVVTGQRYPEEGKYIEQVHSGQNFRITYGFKMILIPGVYFVGGGIWAYTEPSCLHRILDALMFRILPDQKAMSLGYVNTSTMEPNFELI
jgi:lipopolysaccharide transport system ATP-binding protein